jgi:hypothetical protein
MVSIDRKRSYGQLTALARVFGTSIFEIGSTASSSAASNGHVVSSSGDIHAGSKSTSIAISIASQRDPSRGARIRGRWRGRCCAVPINRDTAWTSASLGSCSSACHGAVTVRVRRHAGGNVVSAVLSHVSSIETRDELIALVTYSTHPHTPCRRRCSHGSSSNQCRSRHLWCCQPCWSRSGSETRWNRLSRYQHWGSQQICPRHRRYTHV